MSMDDVSTQQFFPVDVLETPGGVLLLLEPQN